MHAGQQRVTRAGATGGKPSAQATMIRIHHRPPAENGPLAARRAVRFIPMGVMLAERLSSSPVCQAALKRSLGNERRTLASIGSVRWETGQPGLNRKAGV